MFHFRTRYLADDGLVQLGRYHDGSIAIRLFSPMEGPLSTPTVCLSEYGEKPIEGHVFVTENDSPGILASLQELGIIGPALRTVPYGGFGCYAYECELLVDSKHEAVQAI